MCNSTMDSAPLSPIENSSRTKRRLPSPIPFTGKDASSRREILAFPTRTKAHEEEEKEEETKEHNNEGRIENIHALMTSSNTTISSSISLRKTINSKIPKFSNLSPIKISPRVTKDLDHQKDNSFQTQETAPESDSDNDGEDGSCVCILNESEVDTCHCIMSEDTQNSYIRSSSPLSMCSKQSLGVRFADEVGLPIKSILHYECDRRQREHSELVVLCICPEKKSFEFLHVGYFRHQGSDASVEDLLLDLPGMCTNPVFCQSRFTALYRNSNLSFVNLCLPQSTADSHNESFHETKNQLLRDCGFRENEVVVAAIDGSSERAVLEGIGPLLENEKIQQTLKRARRSRRGLKFIRGIHEADNNDKDCHYHLQKRRDLSLRRRQTKQEGRDKKHTDAVPKIETDSVELMDENCHDYDPLYGAAEYHKQLLLGILAIGSGTVVFSVLGL